MQRRFISYVEKNCSRGVKNLQLNLHFPALTFTFYFWGKYLFGGNYTFFTGSGGSSSLLGNNGGRVISMSSNKH